MSAMRSPMPAPAVSDASSQSLPPLPGLCEAVEFYAELLEANRAHELDEEDVFALYESRFASEPDDESGVFIRR